MNKLLSGSFVALVCSALIASPASAAAPKVSGGSAQVAHAVQSCVVNGEDGLRRVDSIRARVTVRGSVDQVVASNLKEGVDVNFVHKTHHLWTYREVVRSDECLVGAKVAGSSVKKSRATVVVSNGSEQSSKTIPVVTRTVKLSD